MRKLVLSFVLVVMMSGLGYAGAPYNDNAKCRDWFLNMTHPTQAYNFHLVYKGASEYLRGAYNILNEVGQLNDRNKQYSEVRIMFKDYLIDNKELQEMTTVKAFMVFLDESGLLKK